MPLNNPNHTSKSTISINLKRFSNYLLVVLIGIEILLVIFDYQINFNQSSQFVEIRDLFNLAYEDGIGSWLSSVQTLLVGLCFGFIFICNRGQSEITFSSIGWLMIAIFFVMMAIDDAAQLHERFASILFVMAEQRGDSLNFFPSHPWQLFFLPIYVVLGFLFSAFCGLI